MLHVYGLEPVWTRMWLRSDCLNANFFWQCEQLHRKWKGKQKFTEFDHFDRKILFTCKVSLQCVSSCEIYVMPLSWTSYHKDYKHSTFWPYLLISSLDIFYRYVAPVVDDVFYESLSSQSFCSADDTHCIRNCALHCVRVDELVKLKTGKSISDKLHIDTEKRKRIV